MNSVMISSSRLIMVPVFSPGYDYLHDVMIFIAPFCVLHYFVFGLRLSPLEKIWDLTPLLTPLFPCWQLSEPGEITSGTSCSARMPSYFYEYSETYTSRLSVGQLSLAIHMEPLACRTNGSGGTRSHLESCSTHQNWRPSPPWVEHRLNVDLALRWLSSAPHTMNEPYYVVTSSSPYTISVVY